MDYFEVNKVKQRHLKEEFDYIWCYCKQTGFDKYITPNYYRFFKNLIIGYGFVNVQQAIRKIKRWKMEYPLSTLETELIKMTVDKEELKKIPAYVDAMTIQYNKKIQEEIENFEIAKLKIIEGDVGGFNNFEERDRSEDNKNGYMSFEEIERKLLNHE